MKQFNFVKKLQGLGYLTIISTVCTMTGQMCAITQSNPETKYDQDTRSGQDEKRSDQDEDRYAAWEDRYDQDGSFDREDTRLNGRFDRGNRRFDRNDERLDRNNRFRDRFDREDRRDGLRRGFDREGQYVEFECRGNRGGSDDYTRRDQRTWRDRDQLRSRDRDYDRDYNRDRDDDRDRNQSGSWGRDRDRDSQSGSWSRDRDQTDTQDRDRKTASDKQASDEQIGKDIHYALSPGYFQKGYEQVRGSVRNGNVTLTGTVDSQKDKEAVEKAVRNIQGVRDIDNNVKVLRTSEDVQGGKISDSYSGSSDSSDEESKLTPDEKIAKEIRYDLSPGMFSKGYDEVTSEVKNGTVTLSGTVQTQNDKEKLENEIRKIRGVRDVKNNVTVEPRSGQSMESRNSRDQEQISDDQLMKDIRYELSPGMFTSGYEQVKVDVKNGQVTLTGSVQTPKDKEEVDKKVRKVKGVRSVDNEVRVTELGG